MTQTIKAWKATDFVGQVIMILIPLIYMTINTLHGGEGFAVVILFTVGAWQLISFFIHLAYRHARWIAGARKVYAYLLFFVGLFGLVAFTGWEVAFGFFYCMLFLGPVLGLIYLIITYVEWQRARLMTRRGRQAL